MVYSLRAKLSLAIALVVLLTVVLISFLANVMIEEQFKNYITRQQDQRTQEIVSELSQQYVEGTWNLDLVHSLGMSALYEGYIIKVEDKDNQLVWDAQAHDMSLCIQIMEDISGRMEVKYPQLDGDFTSKTLHLTQEQEVVGSVSILYYGPFFLTDNDLQFLDTFNTVLIGIAIFSLLFSALVGVLMAKRISRPILETVDAAKQISEGNYGTRIKEKSNTAEIKLLMRSINQLADSLGRQETIRKQLTADVAHELRTPVAIVQANTEAMIEGVWEPTVERLQNCHDEITRIGKLVSDLENLAKVESDNLKLNKTEFNLYELINRVKNSFESSIQDKNLHVTVSGDSPSLVADRDRIRQILANLFSNAVKYTDDGGRIAIEIRETAKSVLFTMKDSGIGISSEDQPYIFERFYRTDKSRTRSTGGSGIGLAIVKSIVEAHGGTVTVESDFNQGSSFKVELPKISHE